MPQPLPQLLATELNQLSVEAVVDVVVGSKEVSRVCYSPHLVQNVLQLFLRSASPLLDFHAKPSRQPSVIVKQGLRPTVASPPMTASEKIVTQIKSVVDVFKEITMGVVDEEGAVEEEGVATVMTGIHVASQSMSQLSDIRFAQNPDF